MQVPTVQHERCLGTMSEYSAHIGLLVPDKVGLNQKAKRRAISIKSLNLEYDALHTRSGGITKHECYQAISS